MYCAFGDIHCAFGDIHCEFGDIYCGFGDIYCEFGDLYCAFGDITLVQQIVRHRVFDRNNPLVDALLSVSSLDPPIPVVLLYPGPYIAG